DEADLALHLALVLGAARQAGIDVEAQGPGVGAVSLVDLAPGAGALGDARLMGEHYTSLPAKIRNPSPKAAPSATIRLPPKVQFPGRCPEPPPPRRQGGSGSSCQAAITFPFRRRLEIPFSEVSRRGHLHPERSVIAWPSWPARRGSWGRSAPG